MSVTPQAFHFHLSHLAGVDKFLIAYSGGIDSHVLLHLCAQLKNSPSGSAHSFSAVYIDHGLSEHSQKWGKHCQHICFELDIPLTIIEVDAQPKKRQSPESAARIARYQAFSQILTENECLLTAQHLDDQAETLLLQLLRGSGSKGLSSMPRIKEFAKGYLCRPMLDYKKQDILSYARQHQLQWIEDESNLQERYERNHLRHTVLPLLEKRWPSVQKSFAKSADLLAESQFLLDSLAKNDIQGVYVVNEEGSIEYDKLRISSVLSLIETQVVESLSSKNYCHSHQYARLNNVLRYWIHLNNLPLPSRKILAQIVGSVIGASGDRVPLVTWRRELFYCEIRRYRDTLYLFDVSKQYCSEKNHQSFNKNEIFELAENHAVRIKSNHSLVKLLEFNPGHTKQKAYQRSLLLSQKISIRFRTGGERYYQSKSSADNRHSRSLKHWFQEQAIPPWEREQLPLIYWGEELIQVGNTILNPALISDDAEDALIICWIKSDSDEIFDKKR